MSEDAIRKRHEALEGTVSTLSGALLRELHSQAHRDRGELLKLLDAEKKVNEELQKFIEEFVPAEVDGEDTGTHG